METRNKQRTAVAALVLSIAGFLGMVEREGYSDKAVIPTEGDRPTLGFGSTFHEDGTPVKMGDTTTPVRALIKAKAHIDKEEVKFRESLPGVELYQEEYDQYWDWAYQFGVGAWLKSPMRTHLLAGQHPQACKALLAYRFVTSSKPIAGWEQYAPKRWRYDCSTPGNKVCRGVWTRQLNRYQACMEAQT